jgi:hypothetical protein
MPSNKFRITQNKSRERKNLRLLLFFLFTPCYKGFSGYRLAAHKRLIAGKKQVKSAISNNLTSVFKNCRVYK